MNLEITEQEKQLLMAAIESAVKHSPNSLQAAATLLPLASKINDLKADPPKAE